MNYIDQFLATRVASLAAGVLLIAGLFDLWAALFNEIGIGSLGIYLVTAGAAVTALALIGLIAENRRFSSERSIAVDAALRLSRGEVIENPGQGELLASVSAISDHFRRHRSAVERIAEGRYPDARPGFGDQDELGLVAERFAEVHRVLAEARAENDSLLLGLTDLADKLSAGARGNLSIRAASENETSGAVAAAFNLFVQNIGDVLRQFDETSGQISTESASVSALADQLARSCSIQSSHTERAISAAAKIASRINEVDENAAAASRMGIELLRMAQTGKRAADDTVGAMHFVRRQVQDTSKRVKRLGERSQEIAQIVGFIDDLSDKTSLLALNAALQASAAGEAGSAFSAIADEVERLAERSRQLATQAATLTQTITSETKEAVACMDDTIREVVLGSALSEKTGKEIGHMEAASQALADSLGRFDKCSKDQAIGSVELSAALSNISDAAVILETVTKRMENSNLAIRALAEQLIEAGSRFRLPADDEAFAPVTETAQLHVH